MTLDALRSVLVARFGGKRIPIVIALVLCCMGCSKPSPPPGANAALAPPRPVGFVVRGFRIDENRIGAMPNPRSYQAGAATMMINWSAPGTPSPEIRLSVDGGAEKLFAGGTSAGSARATFLVPGHVYRFRLYPAKDIRTVLAAVLVEAH